MIKKYLFKNKCVISALALSMLLSGCGSTYKSADSVLNESNRLEMSDSVTGEGWINGGYETESTSKPSTDSQDITEGRKIIEKIYFSVQTREFDSLVENIQKEVIKTGGYVESSTISGNRLDSSRNNRYAELVLRIPSAKSDSFMQFVSENSTVTNKSIDTDDVTLSYVDMESRVKALTTEKEALETLLAKAETVNDIMVIREQLTDVIYEIESYKSRLRTYDNLIEYTTITINVYEVEKIAVVEKQTLWVEIKTGFVDSMDAIGHGMERIFVWITTNIPYFVVYGCIGGIVFGVFKLRKNHLKKKRKNKRNTSLNVSKEEQV